MDLRPPLQQLISWEDPSDTIAYPSFCLLPCPLDESLGPIPWPSLQPWPCLLQLPMDSLDGQWSWLTCLPLLGVANGPCRLSPPCPGSWPSAPCCSLTFIFVSFSAQSLKQETFFRTGRKLTFLCDFEKKITVLKALDKTLRDSSNLAKKSFGSIDYATGNSQKC